MIEWLISQSVVWLSCLLNHQQQLQQINTTAVLYMCVAFIMMIIRTAWYMVTYTAGNLLVPSHPYEIRLSYVLNALDCKNVVVGQCYCCCLKKTSNVLFMRYSILIHTDSLKLYMTTCTCFETKYKILYENLHLCVM